MSQCRAKDSGWFCLNDEGHDGPHRDANNRYWPAPTICDECGSTVERMHYVTCPAMKRRILRKAQSQKVRTP